MKKLIKRTIAVTLLAIGACLLFTPAIAQEPDVDGIIVTEELWSLFKKCVVDDTVSKSTTDYDDVSKCKYDPDTGECRGRCIIWFSPKDDYCEDGKWGDKCRLINGSKRKHYIYGYCVSAMTTGGMGSCGCSDGGEPEALPSSVLVSRKQCA